MLERIFVIERTRDGRLPIRSFGTELVALFGRDLRHQDLARFFPPHDFAMMSAFIGACAEAGAPGVVRLTAETACGRAVGAELLITPLKFDDALGNRYLGLFQSLGGADFLEGRPVQIPRLGSLHPPLTKTQRGVRLVVVND